MSNMRGLAVFISDLRNARARELEEKRVNMELAKIRAKFRDNKLSGYDRKKYVCKLLYMYILGWNITVGHLETVALISSSKYSEKQIGYLGVTLFLNEHHDLLHLVVNSMRKDLLHANELFNCLALHCIGNIGGKEMGVALAFEVHQLLVSGSSRSFVKKKAALTLLRLHRKSPGIIDPQWSPRLIALMSDPDAGVALSVTSLLNDLALEKPECYASAYQRAVQRLNSIVIDSDYNDDDKYYNVPCPWLQIKLMKFLMIFPPASDLLISDLLSTILEHIMLSTDAASKNVQQNNAQNAILFQAIDLAMHLDMRHDFLDQIVTLLSQFLNSKETNIRYLGLEKLSRLSGRSGLLETLRCHQVTLSHTLKDRDVSVRRRALDLLYAMCHIGNAKQTIVELLQYLHISDHSIKEELVLKIAVLVEKYATDYEWYINITLQLLAAAGDHAADEVWRRVVQIVANNEDLQEHAARSVLAYLRAPTCHNAIVRIGGLILGEFGHLIANETMCSPVDQFSALHSKFNIADTQTRAILLSTYIKFYNLFPEIGPELVLVFEKFQAILDTELQQRACEYLALARSTDEKLIQSICEEMPPYPNMPSKLISKLYIGKGESESFLTSPHKKSTASTALETNEPPAQLAHLSPDWSTGYTRLAWKDNGVLFEDRQLCIIMKSSYSGNKAHLYVTYDNRTSSDFTSFVATFIESAEHSLEIYSKGLPPSKLSSRAQVQQELIVTCTSIFTESPLLKINYFAGALQEVVLRLPIILTKFLETSDNLDHNQFTERWAQLDSPQLQSRRVFPIGFPARTSLEAKLKKVLKGYRWTLGSYATTEGQILGSAVLHAAERQKVGCLLCCKFSADWTQLEFLIRTSMVGVASILLDNLAVSLPSVLVD